MIGNTKFYLGSIGGTEVSGTLSYNFERGLNVYGGHSINWIGNVALMYPSDYIFTYSLGVDDVCYDNAFECDEGNPSSGWLYNSNIDSENGIVTTQWLLTPKLDEESTAFGLSASGGLMIRRSYSGYGYFFGVTIQDNVRPVVYLKSNVYIADGDGSEDSPFKLSLKPAIFNNKYNSDDIIEYRNEKYYVIDEGVDYVSLLKKKPLTKEEVNKYNGGEYISENGEIAYDSSCDSLGRVEGRCGNSDVMVLLNNWINEFENDLVSVDEYKVRLISEDVLTTKFYYELDGYFCGRDIYISSEDTPEWIYEYSYWTMTPYEDDISSYYIVKQDGSLSTVSATDKYLVRPVINLKKCAIDNSCND